MQLRLLTIPFSHYCEKARWALDLTGLPYLEDAHAPVFHYLHNRRWGAGSTVPALVAPEGVLSDSSDILLYAHRHGVPLYPRRYEAEIRSWEDRFNRVIGPQTRVWAYSLILEQPDLIIELLRSCPKHEQRIAKPLLSQIQAGIKQSYQIRPSSTQDSLREINALWDQTDRILASGQPYLVGEAFSAADLTLGALGGIMVMPPQYGFPYPPLERLPAAMRSEIEARRQTPTGKYVLALFRKHRKGIQAYQGERSASVRA